MRPTIRIHLSEKSLPYPHLLTKVFEYFMVDFSGEDVRMTRTVDVIILPTLDHHQFVKVQGK